MLLINCPYCGDRPEIEDLDMVRVGMQGGQHRRNLLLEDPSHVATVTPGFRASGPESTAWKSLGECQLNDRLDDRRTLGVVAAAALVVGDQLDRSIRDVERDRGFEVGPLSERPGHDRRYAITSKKLSAATGWAPRMPFERGLEATVAWYCRNQTWVERVRSGAYREWQQENYGRRDEQLSKLR